ncbi:MAG: hypothetical protein Q6361_00940, partial [Candidatus Hermodarchaeota archaeon]|nr:hypothetical protein [Candidatus Hermodarchaeota archaeon]
ILELQYSYMISILAVGVVMFYVEAYCQHKGLTHSDSLSHVDACLAQIGYTFESSIYKQVSDEVDSHGQDRYRRSGYCYIETYPSTGHTARDSFSA